MKTSGTLLQRLLLVVAGAFIITAAAVLLIGDSVLKEVVDQGQTYVYGEKLTTIIRTLGGHNDRLITTGRIDSYIQGFQKVAVESIRSAYYRDRQSPDYPVIIDSGGRVILHPSLPRGSTFLAEEEYVRRALQEKKGESEYLFHGREKKWCVFETFEPWNWLVMFTVPQSFKYRAISQFHTKIGWTLLLITSVVLTVLFIYLYRVVKPIVTLSKASRAIAEGDLHIELHSGGKDEIGELIQNFGIMQHAVKTQLLELEQKNTALHDEIEQRRQAVSKLVESEQQYREIFNTPVDAFVLYDAETAEIVDVNQGMLDMFGCTRDEALALQMEGFTLDMPPYTEKEAKEMIYKAMRDGPQSFEWKCRRLNGEEFWAEISLKHSEFGGGQYILAVARDINTRKLAVKALEEEQERLAVTLRSIGDGVVATDEQGKVILLNRVGERLLGVKAKQAVGCRFEELFVLEEIEESRNIVEHLLKGKTIHVDTGLAQQTEGGMRRDVSLTGSPIRGKDRKVIGAVIVVRDITETLKMEVEVIKAKKLESIGMLAGGIAHDFNNLLFAIQGNVNLAISMPEIGQKMQRYLEAADNATVRAAELTQQLLTFAKGGAPCKRPTSLHPLVEQAAGSVLEGSAIKLAYQCEPDLWPVNMDTNQLFQVVQNIVRNGMQAMGDEGSITIRCENHFHEQGKGGILSPGRYVHVSVHDEGKGIASEHLDKIFDPYFSLDRDGQGLGLAICHSVIRNHDGLLTVESEEGVGSVFHFYLPAEDQDKVQPPADEEMIAGDTLVRVVMVMDDEQMIRDLVSELLAQEGYKVVTAEDGEQAIEKYRQMLEKGRAPDVVLMDLTIPGGMGGKDAGRIIKKIDPSARLIVSSGYSNDQVLARHEEYGFCMALMKPYRKEDLLRGIAKAVGVA